VIRTISRRSGATHRVLGSRFLAVAAPADSEEEARETVEVERQANSDARHHCFAWRIGTDEDVRERVHDAGEPSGSAGAPILSAIRGAGLTQVVVVVMRYFGGTKLGLGGLARAYREAARLALDQAGAVERPPRVRIEARVPPELAGEARALVARCGGILLGESHGESAVYRISLGEDREPELRRLLGDLTRGRVRWGPA
jgi:uncharacterized YigZ family protein